MNRIFQGLLLVILLVTLPTYLSAKDELTGKYAEPSINKRLFGNELSMTNNERDDYATNLAAIAVKQVQQTKGSQKSLDQARKLLGLALHLSPRNRKGLVVNRQLKDGILPQKVAADYDAEVFSKLLLARGQLLEEQDGELNALLARYFIELAATIDPRNEDAVYESELRRIDHGELSWNDVTEAKRKSTMVLPK